MAIYRRIAMVSLVSVTLLSGCATTVPLELKSAREAYRQASIGPAAASAPAELHIASQALAQAEASFVDEPDSYQTRDLAYVAQRKAELATAKALILKEQLATRQAKSDYATTQSQIVADTKENLNQSNQALAESQKTGAVAIVALRDSERTEKMTAEQLVAAQAALAKLGGTREESRGMVITLSGSVLFASNQAVLLPEARVRLDQVVAALLVTRERKLAVEGYTDSRGTDAMNLELSQRRAEAVRKYVVDHGYEADLVVAQGFGEGKPIADNESAEGRANNRRVEIIVMRAPSAAGATVSSSN